MKPIDFIRNKARQSTEGQSAVTNVLSDTSSANQYIDAWFAENDSMQKKGKMPRHLQRLLQTL